MDADVAELNGLDTREISQEVRHSRGKFVDCCLIELDADEKKELIKNFDRLKKLKHSSATVKDFTEKGVYMLPTILKAQGPRKPH